MASNYEHVSPHISNAMMNGEVGNVDPKEYDSDFEMDDDMY